jgi:hypothetical protein
MADVEILAEQVVHLGQLDHRYGSAPVREQVVQRYYIQGLDLAMRAGNRAYAAEMLSEMSRMTLLIGQNARTEHDRLRHGRQAAALARAGLTLAQGTAAPVLVAELHAMDGRALAALGDTRGARHAVLSAQRLFESLRPDDEAPVFYSEAAIAAELGRCLRDLGGPNRPSR